MFEGLIYTTFSLTLIGVLCCVLAFVFETKKKKSKIIGCVLMILIFFGIIYFAICSSNAFNAYYKPDFSIEQTITK